MCKIPNPEHTYKIGYGSRFTPHIQHHSSDGNVACPVRLHPPIDMTLGESSWWPCVARYLASQTEQCTSSPALAKVHAPSQTFIEGLIMNDFLGTIPHSLGQLVMVEKAANYSLLLLLAINAIIHSDVLNVRVWQILMWHLLLVSTLFTVSVLGSGLTAMATNLPRRLSPLAQVGYSEARNIRRL